MRDHISVSQIKEYMLCSLKYRFHYIDDIPAKTKPVAIAFGSAMHGTLEWLHLRRKTGETPPLEEISKVFSLDWRTETIYGSPIAGNGLDGLESKGIELFRTYMDFLQDEPKPKEVEYDFLVEMVDPATGEALGMPLKGSIDLINEKGWVVDHKTCAKTQEGLSSPFNNYQLSAYSYAFRKLFGEREAGLRIDAFIKTKAPKIERFETQRTERDHTRLFNIAKRMLVGVKTGVFIPVPNYTCPDCEYKEICLQWDG